MFQQAQRETIANTTGYSLTLRSKTRCFGRSPTRPCRKLRRALIAACAVLASAPGTKAAVLTVGSGPFDQYSKIQTAIDAAIPGDEITVAAGTYLGPGNRDIDFKGKALVLRSLDGPDVTIIDCENAGRGFYLHQDEGRDTVIEGFTIQAGMGTPGAAIRLEPGSPTVRNCIITGNTGFPAVSMWESEPIIDNCVISQNIGDGISAWGGCTIRSCTIENNQGRGIAHAAGQILACTISGNTSDASRGDTFGGGVHGYEGQELILAGCTLTQNKTKFGGGGVYLERIGHVVVTNCTFLKNHAAGGGGFSSGTFTANPPLVQFCDFIENTADGGGAIASSGMVTIQNCRLLRNTANTTTGCAGGLSASSLTLVSNTLFQGNQAALGGACAMSEYSYSNLTLINCTFTANTASVKGGALDSPNGNAKLFGCIFWGDSAPVGSEINLRQATLSTEYSDIQGGRDAISNFVGAINWGEGNKNTDPLFLATDNFHLIANSPCIDAAGGSVPVEPVLTELDHKPRSQDGNGDGTFVPDMGAYEYGDEPAEIRPVALVVYGPKQVMEGGTAQFTATAY